MCELSFPADYETCTTKEGQRTKDCPPFRHAYRSHRFFVKEKWEEKRKMEKWGDQSTTSDIICNENILSNNIAQRCQNC